MPDFRYVVSGDERRFAFNEVVLDYPCDGMWQYVVVDYLMGQMDVCEVVPAHLVLITEIVVQKVFGFDRNLKAVFYHILACFAGQRLG